MNQTQKTIGILGGMGPEATTYLFEWIIKMTQAEKDQDHIPMIVYNDPKVPDRTPAILENKESPVPALIKGAQILEAAGADFILVPCITAHYFLEEVSQHIDVPFISLLDAVLEKILAHPAQPRRIGVIATPATIETRLFQNLLESAGLEPVIYEEEYYRYFLDAVYGAKGVKAGFSEGPRALIRVLSDRLLTLKAQGIIAGCTEIPLVISQDDMAVPFFNPIRSAAGKAIVEAGYKIKK